MISKIILCIIECENCNVLLNNALKPISNIIQYYIITITGCRIKSVLMRSL